MNGFSKTKNTRIKSIVDATHSTHILVCLFDWKTVKSGSSRYLVYYIVAKERKSLDLLSSKYTANPEKSLVYKK
jgi:hypothetical protein